MHATTTRACAPVISSATTPPRRAFSSMLDTCKRDTRQFRPRCVRAYNTLCACMHLYVCMYLYACMHACQHRNYANNQKSVQENLCKSARTHNYNCKYTHTISMTHAHTHTHTHTHIRTHAHGKTLTRKICPTSTALFFFAFFLLFLLLRPPPFPPPLALAYAP